MIFYFPHSHLLIRASSPVISWPRVGCGPGRGWGCRPPRGRGRWGSWPRCCRRDSRTIHHMMISSQVKPLSLSPPASVTLSREMYETVIVVFCVKTNNSRDSLQLVSAQLWQGRETISAVSFNVLIIISPHICPPISHLTAPVMNSLVHRSHLDRQQSSSSARGGGAATETCRAGPGHLLAVLGRSSHLGPLCWAGHGPGSSSQHHQQDQTSQPTGESRYNL